MKIGTIHKKDTLFLRIAVGSATNGKNKYTMDANAGDMSPIVRNEKTGKWFTLSWQEIIALAEAAGVAK